MLAFFVPLEIASEHRWECEKNFEGSFPGRGNHVIYCIKKGRGFKFIIGFEKVKTLKAS